LDAWQRSKTGTRSVTTTDSTGGESSGSSVSKTKRQSHGDVKYLQVAAGAIKQTAELLGLQITRQPGGGQNQGGESVNVNVLVQHLTQLPESDLSRLYTQPIETT